VQTSFFKGILVESSSNARRVFFKKSCFLVFRIWSVFFVFPLFVLTCCKLGALDFIILLRFHSNRIIQTRIFLYVCKTPAAIAAADASAEPAAATPPPQRPPPPRPSPPWSPPPRPPPPRKRAAVAATPLSASAPKIQTSIFCTGVVSEIQNSSKFGFFGLSAFGMNSCGSSRFWNIPAGTDFQKF
jgi:hypothetical protein